MSNDLGRQLYTVANISYSMVIIAAYSLIIAHPGPVLVRGLNEGPAAQEQTMTEGKVRNALESPGESD